MLVRWMLRGGMSQARGDYIQPSVDAKGSLEEKGYGRALPDVMPDAVAIKDQVEAKVEVKNGTQVFAKLNLNTTANLFLSFP